MAEQFRITGHRGAKALAPENTMRSFALAIEIGADAVELDVHLSADDVLIVMHDRTVDRTTDGTGAVGELTLAELKRLDAGEGEKVPELAEVLDGFEKTRIQIEVKDVRATSAVTALLRERRDRAGSVMITSFHPEALREAALADRHWELGLICWPNSEGNPAIGREIGVDQLLTHWDRARDPEIVRYREQGGRVSIGPVDTEDLVERAIREGYMGATANDPRMALRVRARVLAEQVRPK